VKIARTANQTSVSGFQGNLSPFKGDGQYTFSATMFMPAGAGTSTVQFEKVGQPANNPLGFLHLDFLPSNKVRIDDDELTTFGVFPRNKPFIVQVSLNTKTRRRRTSCCRATGRAARPTGRSRSRPWRTSSARCGSGWASRTPGRSRRPTWW
jgi:hypothetical protein